MGRTYRKPPVKFDDERKSHKSGKRPSSKGGMRVINNLLEEDFDDKVEIGDEVVINNDVTPNYTMNTSAIFRKHT